MRSFNQGWKQDSSGGLHHHEFSSEALAEDAEVRPWAVRSLTAIGDRRAADPIRSMLDDEARDVAHWAAVALERFGER